METKRAIVIGASSGIGREVAKRLAADGWMVGVSARREELLFQLKDEIEASAAAEGKGVTPRVFVQPLDVTLDDSRDKVTSLIDKMGGVDLFFMASGTGSQNQDLNPVVETSIAKVNVIGFMNMIDTAYNHMRTHGGGHIAIISSVAGIRGIGASPAYCATKRFQMTYLDALDQLSHVEKNNITFTDIRPGFVKTEMLKHDYPMVIGLNRAVDLIMNAVYRGTRVSYIDWRFHLLAVGEKLVIRPLWVRMDMDGNVK